LPYLYIFCINIKQTSNQSTSRLVGSNIAVGHGTGLIRKVSFVFITQSLRERVEHRLFYILNYTSHNARSLKAAHAGVALSIVFQYRSFLIDTTSVLEIVPEYFYDKKRT